MIASKFKLAYERNNEKKKNTQFATSKYSDEKCIIKNCILAIKSLPPITISFFQSEIFKDYVLKIL